MNEILLAIVAAVLVVAVGAAAWTLGRYYKMRHQAPADNNADRFKALFAEALASNNQTFVALAEQTIKRLYNDAGQDLNNKEQAIKQLIEPLQKAVEESRQQTTQIEQQRHRSFGEINKQLEYVRQTGELIGSETKKLVQAFKNPQVRGQWGELSLERLLELAGMSEHCDYSSQTTLHEEEQRLRPDVIIHTPNQLEIIIDAKTPLDAYLRAVEMEAEANQETHQQILEQHAQNVRNRIKEVAKKNYWQSLAKAPDFILLYIPGDQFLAAALKYDDKLMDFAFNEKVVLCTPGSLVALLRVIAYGWQQEKMAHNAEEIQRIGQELYKRFNTFTEHLSQVGKSLDRSVDYYNKAVGSFGNRLLPGAKKFTELGVSQHEEIKPPPVIEKKCQEPYQETPADKDNSD